MPTLRRIEPAMPLVAVPVDKDKLPDSDDDDPEKTETAPDAVYDSALAKTTEPVCESDDPLKIRTFPPGEPFAAPPVIVTSPPVNSSPFPAVIAMEPPVSELPAVMETSPP